MTRLRAWQAIAASKIYLALKIINETWILFEKWRGLTSDIAHS